MVVLTQELLDEIAVYVANNLLSHATVGIGDDPILTTSTDIETPVQIGAVDRNKAADSISVVDNFMVMKYKLTVAEPDSQPVNISEVGIQPGANTADELKAGVVFLASTKDNASQWTLRFSGRVIEGV